LKGFSVRENELGITAVRIHYSADPEKDPDTEGGRKWIETMRRLYPDPNNFAQELEINFWVAQGTRVYPQFTEAQHAIPTAHRERKVLYRSWDFGWHAPVCLVGQIDPQDRLVCLREIVGHETTTKEFAEDVVARCATWYPTHSAGFQDFCDPAGQQVDATASERSEARDVEVLNKLGVYPKWEYGWSRKHGRALVHQLLQVRQDNTPSLYVDSARCPVLMQGFLGKYVYPEKRGGQVADEPDESNHPWADAHAALRYLVTGLYTSLGLKRPGYTPPVERPVDYTGYGIKNKRRNDKPRWT
jgi:hypothetical protein